MACAIARPGGTVHVVHVVPRLHTDPVTQHDVFALERSEAADARRNGIHSALADLIPAGVRDRRLRFYALESNDPAAAICQGAARLDADAVCLGRRGRSNLAATLLGSVSKDVLSTARCPVMLAQAPRD
jgi:nucleotide-binding universal stress UspA family protein